jgi:uncharacterized protein involved in cysteine biosynthesis
MLNFIRMSLITPILAPFKGFQLCFNDPQLRRFAGKPWMIGGISYLLLVIGAIFLHTPLTHEFASSNHSAWPNVLAVIIWLAVTFGLLFLATLLTISIVLISGGYYHFRIAHHILVKEGIPSDEERFLSELGRTMVTETLKLLWLLPLFIITFIIGVIPFLTPLAFVLGSLLLAYQFFDYPLEFLRLGAFGRFGFLLKHMVTATLFGATLLVLSAIPFVALFISPIAVAGASWLFIEMKWIGVSKS